MCCKKSNANHIPFTPIQCIDIIDNILVLEQDSISRCPCKNLQQFLSDQVIYGFILVILNFISLRVS